MRHAAVVLALALLPVCASASGFPDSSLWLSNPNPLAGETVYIYAAIHNGGVGALDGEAVFFSGNERIGSAPFSLEPGASGIVSIPWNVRAGEYVLKARIEGTAGVSRAQSGSIRLSVAAEKREPLAESVATANGLFASFASSTIPALGDAGKAVYAKTEELRTKGAETLERYLDAKQKERIETSESGNVSSSETQTKTPSVPQESIWSRASQVAAAGALFTLSNQALFYPLLALALLFFLYLFAKRLSGRSYRD